MSTANYNSFLALVSGEGSSEASSARSCLIGLSQGNGDAHGYFRVGAGDIVGQHLVGVAGIQRFHCTSFARTAPVEPPLPVAPGLMLPVEYVPAHNAQ